MKKDKKIFAIIISLLILSSIVNIQPAYGITHNFISVSGGGQSFLALNSDGSIWSWGLNQFGQLGDGTTHIRPYMIKVKGLSDVKAIAASGMGSLAVKDDGTVYAWGANALDQDDGAQGNSSFPIQVQGLSNVKAVSGGTHSVALKNDGTVWAWGNNDHGQLGDDSDLSSRIPVQVSNLPDISAVSAGEFHTLALAYDGTVWSWGHNSSGQLGNGSSYPDALDSYLPEKIEGLSDIVAVSAGLSNSTALKADGTVWAWGDNAYGQLGDGTTNDRAIPVQVSDLTNVKTISSGGRHTMALRQDGTVWVWGIDRTKPSNHTPLGYDILLNPTQVPGLTEVQGIAAGPSNYAAITTTGTILTWGNNIQGISGNGTNSKLTITPSPVVDTLLPASTRLAGYDRFDTSIAISQKMFPADSSTNTVLLATGYNFPDALAGASLGVLENAPLLLIDPYGDNQKTIDEIKRVLIPEGKIYILGGTAVVSSALEAELNDIPYYHYTVQRLAGVTSYGTATEIAKQIKPSGGGEVIIATGENFPDSLSISPYASALGIPMILVQNSNIPAEPLAYLKDLEPTDITIVGGVGAVSAPVEKQLKDLFPEANFRRFGGFDQYETSAIIADALFGDYSPNLFLATGTNFPDALAGSIFAGSTLSPIVLVKPTEIPEKLSSIYLSNLSTKKIIALGGTSVVSENVFKTLTSSQVIDPGDI